MSLSQERLLRLDESLERALAREWPQLQQTQRRLARLRPTAIGALTEVQRLQAIATVATDGGENRLNLEPIRLQIVRVADSLGRIYFEEFIPQSLEPAGIFQLVFRLNPRLQRFLKQLGATSADLAPRSDWQRSQLLALLRELMEWAALYELASQPPARLLIRDGLLRSLLLTGPVFQRLAHLFQALTTRHGHLLVGVAKRSRVLNYLTLALGLNESFAGGQPAYLAIPPELEQEAAPAQYRWIGSRAMGRLHVARLERGDTAPLLPVDVAAWQSGRVAEAMARLRESARGSFPIRGYPQALEQAHEHARLGGMEIELLERLLLEQVAARDPEAARQARELKLLGRSFVDAPNSETIMP